MNKWPWEIKLSSNNMLLLACNASTSSSILYNELYSRMLGADSREGVSVATVGRWWWFVMLLRLDNGELLSICSECSWCSDLRAPHRMSSSWKPSHLIFVKAMSIQSPGQGSRSIWEEDAPPLPVCSELPRCCSSVKSNESDSSGQMQDARMIFAQEMDLTRPAWAASCWKRVTVRASVRQQCSLSRTFILQGNIRIHG